MAILYAGIDLAKNVFALHGVNEAGKAELIRPAVPCEKLHALVASLPPCVIGMEACSGAHHWARQFQSSGHTVRLIAPKFVTPYRMTGRRGKNDAADAQAICEAIQRPHMRFVPIKNQEQQSRLMVHRARQGFVDQRTATLNRIRGLLSEVTRLYRAPAGAPPTARCVEPPVACCGAEADNRRTRPFGSAALRHWHAHQRSPATARQGCRLRTPGPHRAGRQGQQGPSADVAAIACRPATRSTRRWTNDLDGRCGSR